MGKEFVEFFVPSHAESFARKTGLSIGQKQRVG